jgi:hypothetical protein
MMNLREQYIWAILLIVLSSTSLIQCTLQSTEYIQANVFVCVCVCVCGHKWEEMTGCETDLHNVELRKYLKFHGITEFHDTPFPPNAFVVCTATDVALAVLPSLNIVWVMASGG